VTERSPEETEIVKKYLLGLQFCKNLKLKDKHIAELLPNFKSLTVHPNQVIVKFGDIGDKFYITLKGRYAVWVPVLHFHILHFLENLLSVVENEHESKHKLNAIRTLKF
jgi:hypothetical protein